MSEENAVTPAEPVAANVTDVRSASEALEGLLSLPDEGGDLGSDQPQAETVETEAVDDGTPETEPESDAIETVEVEAADDGEPEEGEIVEYEDAETLVEVTLPGGEKAQVTLDELTRGYSRESDYTAKTERLAAERRELAAERDELREAVEAERQQYLQQIQRLYEDVGRDLAEEEQVDWDRLRDEDPIEFATKWADHQRKVEARRVAEAQHQQAQAEEYQRQVAAHNQMLAEQFQRVADVMPDFADPEKGEELKGKMRSFLQTAYGGFSDAEIQGVADARHIQLIHDAMAWRELQAGKGTVEKKVKKLPRVVKPKATKAKTDADAERFAAKVKQARQSGTVESAASALEDIL